MSAPTVRGTKGPVQLGKLLGKGGEGAVYEVPGQPALVAKVYLKEIPPERAEKLRAMAQLLTPKLAALTAWPHDVLYGSGGKVNGFLMPKVNALDVHNVYGPKSRMQHFPQADWRLLVRTALNTARAFAVVHEAGILVADVNHGGVMVSPDATVRLIDCDSFQFSAGSKTFLCEVGVEDFTPPELQGMAFRGVVRTSNHDNFGLAVLIFRLLMLGRHPFAGRHMGKGDLSIGEAIAQCKYAYSRDNARTQMEAPPATPPVLVAGHEIATLWEQAFGPAGKNPRGRPTAEQWVFALQKLEANFAKCSNHGGHYFAKGITCPWCPIQNGTGSPPFPLPAGQLPPTPVGGPFSLEAVWAQITSIPPPGAAAPVTAPHYPQPSAEAREYAASKGRGTTYGVVAGLVAFGCMLAFELNGFLSAFLAFLLYVWIASANAPQGIHPFTTKKQQAEANLRSLTERWNKEASAQAFEARVADLRKRRDELLALPATRAQMLARLQSNIEADQKRRFLDTKRIDKASISGIGPAKKSMLESYGIETAADVRRQKVLGVPGFGPALTQRMLDWRTSEERKFRFNPNAGVDKKAIADVDDQLRIRKRDIEAELRNAVAALQQLRNTILTNRQALEGPMRAAALAVAQADADLSAVR